MTRKLCSLMLSPDVHAKLHHLAIMKNKSASAELEYILESWFKILLDNNKDHKLLQELLAPSNKQSPTEKQETK